MSENHNEDQPSQPGASFFERPQVTLEQVPVGGGVPLGVERVSNPELGIGGAYGTWGENYDNTNLAGLVEQRLGEPLGESERMDLGSLGFLGRHHIPELSQEQNTDLEVAVGARLLGEAAAACGWQPGEVEGVLIGTSGPVAVDYVERIASQAGIPEEALKVSVHKACDGSVGALHLALNPDLEVNRQLDGNLAERLLGKKVLVGGIEGLSRMIARSFDRNALQLFGNGAGVIGLVPGLSMQFLVGQAREAFDEEGVLQVRMDYPHSHQKVEGRSLIEAIQESAHHIRIAGLMHEPQDGRPVVMAGPMGMVKLFVRTGVQVVKDVYNAYQERLAELDLPGKSLAVAIVHHANYKINKLKEKHLMIEGIRLPMPWLVSDFGNVSAASNMIAFLRQLPLLKPGDHVLFDGFGAGTYYDVLAVSLGGRAA